MNEIPYERVKAARDNGRPTGTDYIKNIFKNFTEFKIIFVTSLPK